MEEKEPDSKRRDSRWNVVFGRKYNVDTREKQKWSCLFWVMSTTEVSRRRFQNCCEYWEFHIPLKKNSKNARVSCVFQSFFDVCFSGYSDNETTCGTRLHYSGSILHSSMNHTITRCSKSFTEALIKPNREKIPTLGLVVIV